MAALSQCEICKMCKFSPEIKFSTKQGLIIYSSDSKKKLMMGFTIKYSNQETCHMPAVELVV